MLPSDMAKANPTLTKRISEGAAAVSSIEGLRFQLVPQKSRVPVLKVPTYCEGERRKCGDEEGEKEHHHRDPDGNPRW